MMMMMILVVVLLPALRPVSLRHNPQWEKGCSCQTT